MKRLIALIFCLNVFLFGCQNQSSITQETQNISPEKSVEAEVKTPTPINTISPERARCRRKADKIFYQTYPEREGKTIEKGEEEWANKWLEIRSSISGCEFLAQPKTNPESSSVSTLGSEEKGVVQSEIEPTTLQMNKLKREGVPTVLPKYLPSGFRLMNFEQQSHNNGNNTMYFAFYKGPNRCEVIVSGANGGFGAGMTIDPIVVDTSLFGNVTLETKLDDPDDKDTASGLVVFTQLKNSKEFVGYVVNFDCPNRLFNSQEAIKILKSLYIKNP